MELGLKENVAKHRVVVVMHGASWCAPCKTLRARLNEQGVEFTYVDVDSLPDPPSSVPEVIVWERDASGWKTKTYSGLQSPSWAKALADRQKAAIRG